MGHEDRSVDDAIRERVRPAVEHVRDRLQHVGSGFGCRYCKPKQPGDRIARKLNPTEQTQTARRNSLKSLFIADCYVLIADRRSDPTTLDNELACINRPTSRWTERVIDLPFREERIALPAASRPAFIRHSWIQDPRTEAVALAPLSRCSIHSHAKTALNSPSPPCASGRLIKSVCALPAYRLSSYARNVYCPTVTDNQFQLRARRGCTSADYTDRR